MPKYTITSERQAQIDAINADLREQTGRSEFMHELYRRSGRTCGTWSGLWFEFKAQLLDELAQQMAIEKRNAWCKENLYK